MKSKRIRERPWESSCRRSAHDGPKPNSDTGGFGPRLAADVLARRRVGCINANDGLELLRSR
jgi:hypothetical protein